ncbi:SusC/RagA family TonB-linked outer membrane protein [Mariniphaga sediminis]|uniref:SusC/RagA family TonB-linked outer membrane protein n=1 Tax=Mariniphaga sediminis TaxID=1628158 RepID=UPI0035651C2E
MKKNNCLIVSMLFWAWKRKLVFVMRLTFSICLLSVLQSFAISTFSQNSKLSIKQENISVESVIQLIQEQTDYHFMYSGLVVDVKRTVDLNIKKKSVPEILEVVFKNTDVTYKINGRLIALNTVRKNSSAFFQKQNVKISGQVSDSSGSPLPGVTVVIKGTTNGTVTNADGEYSISNIPDDAVLVFSFVGMRTMEVIIAGKTIVDVSMEEETIGIEEVVAVGYGTMKKIELTNAVSSIKSKDFVKGSITDAAQLIKGQVAGVNIVNPDANPTGTSQILLRGITTLASGTQPLVVIDGVPGSLKDVAPDDIESMDILKDGSGAAIYGTRGTNGVILITTKKVKGETPATIELNSYITTQSITKTLEFMDSEEYRELVKQGKPGAMDYGSNTNWVDEIFRTPISQTHNISMKGGNANTNYIMNVNYKALEGLMLRSDNNVLNAHIQANHIMFDGKLRINGSIMGYDQKYFSGGGGSSYRNALIYNPTDSPKDEDGNWTEHPEMNNYANPIAAIEETEGTTSITNFKPFGTITVYPFDGLTLKILGSRNIFNNTSGYSQSFNHLSSITNSRTGYAARNTIRSVDDLIELTVNYKKSFKDHNLSFLGGYSFQENQYEDYGMNNYDFPSDLYSYNNMSVGAARTQGKAGLNSYKRSSKLVSYFARGNYNFGDKYLIMASVRYEGSTKFGKDNKWGAFPAISAGWNIINESFMEDYNFFSALKIRGGIGLTGTAPSSSYQSLSRLSYGNKYLYNGEWTPVIYPGTNANPDLKWEKKEEINIGLEFGFFKDRISGAIDIYKRTTKDLLWNYSVSTPPFLYSSVLANAGVIQNKGIEVQINATPVQSSTLYWNTTVNFSTNNNKLVSLSNDQFKLENNYFYTGYTGEPIQSTTHIVEEGKAIGNFYGFKSIGLDDDGRWIIEGEDGNPKPIADQQPDDRKVLGNGLPNYYLNWNNTLNYKQFDVNVTMRGAFDYQILNMTKMFYSVPAGLTRGNVMKSTYDNIFGNGPISDYQEHQYVSYFIEDGGFWKIDNITLGYNINLKTKSVKSLRLYASGSNMFTFSDYSGIDPEVNSLGLNPGSDYRDRYPSTRTYTFGILAKF